MTVKELKELLNEYPDEMLVLVETGKEGDCHEFGENPYKDTLCNRANIEDGCILALEDDEDFDEETCVLLLDATN